MVRLTLLLSLFGVSLAAINNSRSLRKKVRKLPSLSAQDDVWIFYDKEEFKKYMARLNLEMEEEDFSAFLGNETTVDLEVGENDVGWFEINIEHETDPDINVGSIQSNDDGEGFYVGTYENVDTMEVKFEKFQEDKTYAFAAKWDIEQDVDDLVDDDWYNHMMKESTRERGKDDDEYWTGGGDWSDGWRKMLHLKVGEKKFNLVDELNYGQTDWLGFYSRRGFVSMEIFSPANEEPIDFVMSEVYVSNGTPTEGVGAYGSIFEIMQILLSYLLYFDFSSLIAFIQDLVSRSGD